MTFRLGTASKYGLGKDAYGLFRAMAQDNARMSLENAGVPDMTDNSTGTKQTSFPVLQIPVAAFDATSAGGAQRAAFNTALDKFENGCKVIVNSLNNARARVGLTMIGTAGGTQAAANTIPAQDKTVASATGTSALDFRSGVAAMNTARLNMNKLARAFNEVLIAIGATPISAASIGGDVSNYSVQLSAIPDADASADGSSAVAKTVADAFLTALADSLATIAYIWNGYMVQTGFSDLTDSSGGTVSNTLAANALPALAAGAATTSAPKAGFDTALGVIENNLSEVTTRVNDLSRRYGLSPLVDSTGQTVNGTLESQSVALTAVDGSTGTVAVDGASARARMTTINNAVSTLASRINTLVGFAGPEPLTDNVGGVISVTVADIAATAAGVGQDTVPGGTLLNSAVNTWLTNTRNAISSLAGKVNEMTGSDVPKRPLQVVAV